MKTVLVIMSHDITQAQIDDFGGKVIMLKEINPSLQLHASNISPKATLTDIEILADRIASTAQMLRCSHIAVMGEPTLVMHTALYANSYGIIPITSTTERISKDVLQADGSVVKTAIFNHVMWREML
jgi:hypothetical protein